MLRALAALSAMLAVLLMTAAIVGLVTGRPSDRAGFFLRLMAVLAFAIAVGLNVAAH